MREAYVYRAAVWMFAAVVASLLTLPGLAEATPPQASGTPLQFAPAQRAEIVAIVRLALHEDPSILRDAIAAMQADDNAKHYQAARTAIADVGAMLTANPGDPTAGNPKGDVTVVEFYDPRCPYCRRLLPTISTLLHDDPNIRLVYKDLPILGPASTIEARALLAAERQGGYLKLQDALMHNSAPVTLDVVRSVAERVGLDGARLAQDMQDPAIQSRLDANLALAHKLGIEGTPALVIGTQMIPGAVELPEIQRAIASARQGD